MADPAAVEAGYVVRMAKAYPYYDADYKRNVDKARSWLAENVPNLHPVGRNGMHRYNNQDHSMLTAMTAVDNILGGVKTKANLWEINTEQEYHEELKPGGRPAPGGNGSGRDAPVLPKRARAMAQER